MLYHATHSKSHSLCSVVYSFAVLEMYSKLKEQLESKRYELCMSLPHPVPCPVVHSSVLGWSSTVLGTRRFWGSTLRTSLIQTGEGLLFTCRSAKGDVKFTLNRRIMTLPCPLMSA